MLITSIAIAQNESFVSEPFSLSIGPMGFDRQITEKTIDYKNAPFGQINQSESTDKLTITPFDGLGLGFTNKRQQQVNLKRQTINMSEDETLDLTYQTDRTKLSFSQNVNKLFDPSVWDNEESLDTKQEIRSQSFGFEQEIGQLKFTANRNSETKILPNERNNTQNKDSINFSLPLDFVSFNYNYDRTTNNGSLISDNSGYGIKIPFNSENSFNYDFLKKTDNNTRMVSFGISNPILLSGLSLLFHHNQTTANNDIISYDDLQQITTKLFGGELKYIKSSIIKTENNKSIETINNEIIIPLGLTSYHRNDQITQNSRNLQENISIPLDLLLNGSIISYDRNLSIIPGKPSVDVSTSKILIPLSFVNNGGNISLISKDTNGQIVNDMTVNYPAVILGIPLNMVYSHITNKSTGQIDSRFFTVIDTPIVLHGNNLHLVNTLSLSTLGEDKVLSELSINKIVLTRSAITKHDNSSNNITYTAEIPEIIPFKGLSLKTNALLLQQDEKENQYKSNIIFAWSPIPNLDTRIILSSNDLVPNEHQTKTIETKYGTSERLSLNIRYLERQQLDSVNLDKQSIVSLQHISPNTGGLSIKTTLVDVDGQNQDSDPMNSAEISFGSEKSLQITANTSDFDAQKMAPLNRRVIGINAKSIFGDNGILIKYQDSVDRNSPILSIDTSWKLSQNTEMKISMANNGVDPTDNKHENIRVGTVWDAILSTKSDNLELGLGIRNFEQNNWVNLGIAGSLSNNDKMSLTYQNGDFVSDNDSILSLKYDKSWNDNGNLSLSLYQKIKDGNNDSEAKVNLDIKF